MLANIFGSKVTAWLGVIGSIAATLAGAAGTIGGKAAGVAAIVSAIIAAMGGSIARPSTASTRAGDR